MLALVCLSTTFCANAVTMADGKDALVEQFVFGEGPAVDGYSVDYRYFSPVGENDNQKYPLVIWLHGMGDGSSEGAQVSKSDISYWSSEDFQSRFDPAGGAFILAARSREESGNFWSDDMTAPLRAAIDDFIAKNKDNIDLTRIYVGGYSMGGKMTLRMAVAYPEMFAAAFPICSAWSVHEEYVGCLADLPLWLTSSSRDPLVNYYMAVLPTWNRLMASSNVAEDCRFSTLTKVCYHDGKKTSSSHHAWFAVNYDLFSIENGDYPYMSTVNGLGEEVTLEYPNGMISWLTSHTSDYDGSASDGMGNLNGETQTDGLIYCDGIVGFFDLLFDAILRLFKIK
jgi:predicted peptidase